MQYIPALASVHYYMQMSKQMFYKDAKTRRLIVRYFVINEKNLDYSLCKTCDNDFKKNRLKFRAKSVFLWIFTSRLYCKYKIKKITKRKKAA